MSNPYENTIFQKVLDDNIRTDWGRNPEKAEKGDEQDGRKDEQQPKTE